jgi:hypothetical protein
MRELDEKGLNTRKVIQDDVPDSEDETDGEWEDCVEGEEGCVEVEVLTIYPSTNMSLIDNRSRYPRVESLE